MGNNYWSTKLLLPRTQCGTLFSCHTIVTSSKYTTKMARYSFNRIARSGKHSAWSTHSAQVVLIRCLLFVYIVSNVYLYNPIPLLMLHAYMHCFLVEVCNNVEVIVVLKVWSFTQKVMVLGWGKGRASRIPIFQAPSARSKKSNGPVIQFYSGMYNIYYRPRSSQAYKPSFCCMWF
jgi:hypothetical protein